jgi:hypothetical protein
LLRIADRKSHLIASCALITSRPAARARPDAGFLARRRLGERGFAIEFEDKQHGRIVHLLVIRADLQFEKLSAL